MEQGSQSNMHVPQEFAGLKPDGLNIVVFDCEIKNVVDGKIVRWSDFHLMGHAVSCLYDYRSGNYGIFMLDNVDEMINRINEADLVVAFNNKGFDNKLLLGDPSITVKLRPDIDNNCYDMLEVTRRSVGWRGGRFPSGMKLDDHLSAMFGADGMKSGDGAEAPALWQQKKLGKLCSYVIRDVNREKALFEAAWYDGVFKTATHGEKQVERPQAMLAKILADRKTAFEMTSQPVPETSGAV